MSLSAWENPPLEDKRPQRLRKDWKNIWEKAQIANSPVKVLYKSSAVVCEQGEDATERVFSLGDKSSWLTGLSHFPAGLAAWLLTMMALNM